MSRRAAMTIVLVLLLAAVCGGMLGAQEHVPKPYSPDEFPPWLKDLYRAEVITVGSFPFALFLTLEAYDTWRYVTYGFNTSYAPWPIGSGVTYSAQETTWLAVSAISISVFVAGLDFLLGRLNESSPRR
jgi:hypothetical protein